MQTSETARLPRSLGQRSVDYVVRSYRRLLEDPEFFWMKTAARFELARELAARVADDDPDDALRSSSLVSQHPSSHVLATLRRDGYYVGLSLAPTVLAQLHAHMARSPCYGDRKRDQKMQIHGQEDAEALGGHLKVASYFNQQEDWPAFRAVREDPWLLSVARAYLGCEPVYQRSEIAWSFARRSTREEKRNAAQVLHCDINDFKTLKVFFYLSDVDAHNGPHSFIKKHPRRRTLKHQILGQRCASLTERELIDTYGLDQLVTILGPAGLGFAGDPYYFHRGTTPIDGARAILQLEFGRRKYKTWYFDV